MNTIAGICLCITVIFMLVIYSFMKSPTKRRHALTRGALCGLLK